MPVTQRRAFETIFKPILQLGIYVQRPRAMHCAFNRHERITFLLYDSTKRLLLPRDFQFEGHVDQRLPISALRIVEHSLFRTCAQKSRDPDFSTVVRLDVRDYCAQIDWLRGLLLAPA